MTHDSRAVAVITGASGGIGAATARRLVQDGFDVVAHYATGLERARLLRDTVVAAGGTCWLVQADLATVEGVDSLVDQIDEILTVRNRHQLLGLVNNAARMLGPAFASATAREYDAYFALNTRAPFLLTQALAERMPRGGGIVNVSSAAAHFASPGDIVYAMTKAAIESLTVNAAPALAHRGIRINTVVPGFTDNGHAAFRDPQIREHMSGLSVFGDVATPEAVAEAVSFLLSERASRTTGATLDVSGGSTIGARRGTATLSLRERATR